MLKMEEETKTRGPHNWKQLFRKPNILEWTIFAMLVLSLFMVYAYQRDMAECRNFLNNVETNACAICQQFTEQAMNQNNPLEGLPFLINEENNKSGLL